MTTQLIRKEEFRWSFMKKGSQVLNVCTRLLFMFGIGAGLLTSTTNMAFANPTDGVVAAGAATIATAGSEVLINQSSASAIIDWQSFDIATGETTRFSQPDASSVALNRIMSSTQLTSINGNLIANGRVFVINPNGAMLGAGANVNTAGFIASTANIANDAFMNSTGAYDFNMAGNQNASVVNNGTVTVQDAGLVAFVAPNVANNGVIQGNLAKIELGAADTFGVDLYGDGLIHLAVDAPASASRSISATNNGSLVADGGTVLMTAAAASNVNVDDL